MASVRELLKEYTDLGEDLSAKDQSALLDKVKKAQEEASLGWANSTGSVAEAFLLEFHAFDRLLSHVAGRKTV